MAISRILIQDGVGELRAAALGPDDRPVALFSDRWSERNRRARWGDVSDARLRRKAPGQGGGFLELASGEEAFLKSRDMTGLNEGAACQVRIVAEARHEKLARAVLHEGEGDALTPVQRWQASLPGAVSLTPETEPDTHDLVENAFADITEPSVILPGGGRLQITPAPALVAIDVDTAGRYMTGRAASRVRQLNIEAAREAARQLALRGFGGLAVLDCLSPITRDVGKEIRAAFLQTFGAISPRKVKCLGPSAFGLLEISLEWRERPHFDVLGSDTAAVQNETRMLDAIRNLEREARARPAAQIRLSLPAAWLRKTSAGLVLYREALHARYGSRIEIVSGNCETYEITRI